MTVNVETTYSKKDPTREELRDTLVSFIDEAVERGSQIVLVSVNPEKDGPRIASTFVRHTETVKFLLWAVTYVIEGIMSQDTTP